MGQPKLLLPWGGRTVIEHLIEQSVSIRASQIAVVIAADNESMANAVRGSRAEVVPNPDPDRGMFSSVRCAAEWSSWNPALTHWVISLGDQPHLRDTTLAALIDAARAEPQCVWQPVYQGRRRHPVVLPKRSFMDLARTRATDLKSFLESSSVARRALDSDDAGLEIDIDTPDDYARAKKLAGLD
jgi:CTP:molybdopterin cytidylyltransferase MocA